MDQTVNDVGKKTNEFYQVIISAPAKKEARTIAQQLVKNKLVAGTLIVKGESIYWWNKKIVNKTYYNVQAFSISKNRHKIIREVKKLSSDECPCISFTKIDGNKEFLEWIGKTVK